MTLKIEPTADMVLLRPAQGEEKTKGGIIIPDEARSGDNGQKCVRAEVLATGPGRLNERLAGQTDGVTRWEAPRLPMNCKPGDVVLFERGIGGGYEIVIDGEKLYMTRDACVVAKIRKES